MILIGFLPEKGYEDNNSSEKYEENEINHKKNVEEKIRKKLIFDEKEQRNESIEQNYDSKIFILI